MTYYFDKVLNSNSNANSNAIWTTYTDISNVNTNVLHITLITFYLAPYMLHNMYTHSKHTPISHTWNLYVWKYNNDF